MLVTNATSSITGITGLWQPSVHSDVSFPVQLARLHDAPSAVQFVVTPVKWLFFLQGHGTFVVYDPGMTKLVPLFRTFE